MVFRVLTAHDLSLIRSANRFSDETGGNGIFSIRRRAAEMNGEIQIVSERGKGTGIFLNLPLERTAQTGGEVKIETS
ncbi:MAG: hypothetical protein M3Q33_02280 [Acidobacteriota bacterium]|nr:hypothetical protein [Acidobacteriota bacterium]